MYYTDFDSFTTALSECRSFVVSVSTVTGETHESSPYPISVHTLVSKYFDDTLEARSPVTIWNRLTKCQVTVPASNVRCVTIRFI
jgi:hypothetical protein